MLLLFVSERLTDTRKIDTNTLEDRDKAASTLDRGASTLDRAVFSQISQVFFPSSSSSLYTDGFNDSIQSDSGQQMTGKMVEMVERYRCQLCNKINGSRKALERHLLTHTGEKNHVCYYCNQAFSLSSNMYRHIRSRHDPNFMPK